MLGTNGSTRVIAAAGVAGALILLRRALSKRALAAGRNKLDLQLPVPGDIEISQAVKLTPVRELFYDAFGLGDEELFSLPMMCDPHLKVAIFFTVMLKPVMFALGARLARALGTSLDLR